MSILAVCNSSIVAHSRSFFEGMTNSRIYGRLFERSLLHLKVIIERFNLCID